MTWFEIKMIAPKIGEARIYDYIGKDYWGDGSAVEAKKFIDSIQALGEIDELVLRINSPGGSVFEGTAIYNYLKNQKAKVTVYIDGLAASMATVIAMAGNEINIPENALFMIHNPFGVAYGEAKDMLKMADLLEKMKENAISAYLKSGESSEAISQMMDSETWMTGKEAVKKGFATNLLDAVEAKACIGFDFSRYKNAPESVKMSLPAPVLVNKKEETHPMNVSEFKEKHPELYKQIKDEQMESQKAEINAALAADRKAQADRIADIRNLAIPGYEALTQSAIDDPAMTAEKYSMALLAAQKKEQEAIHKTVIQSMIPPVDEAASTIAPKQTIVPKTLEQATDLWNADPQLKEKFSCPENYFYLHNNKY